MEFGAQSRAWNVGRVQARSHGHRLARRHRLMLLLGIVILAGILAQITLIVRISGQLARADELESEIEILYSQAGNYERSINEHHNLPYIEQQARMLGLDVADSSCVRMVSVG